MGFTDECFNQSEDDMIDEALSAREGTLDPQGWLQGITRERLEAEGHARLNLGDGPFLPFANGGFTTPSGKAEFYTESLQSPRAGPGIVFHSADGIATLAEGKVVPLELLARKADNFLNSSFCNVQSVQKMEQPDLLEIHTATRRTRGIREGDWVRVFNGRGEVRLRAHVNGSVQPGVVAAQGSTGRAWPRTARALTS